MLDDLDLSSTLAIPTARRLPLQVVEQQLRVHRAEALSVRTQHASPRFCAPPRRVASAPGTIAPSCRA
eukprot:9476327-Pyramimonas_sp.AAC.1